MRNVRSKRTQRQLKNQKNGERKLKMSALRNARMEGEFLKLRDQKNLRKKAIKGKVNLIASGTVFCLVAWGVVYLMLRLAIW